MKEERDHIKEFLERTQKKRENSLHPWKGSYSKKEAKEARERLKEIKKYNIE